MEGSTTLALELVRRAVWETLYADDAGIVSRSPAGLVKIMAIFVEVYAVLVP